MDPIKNPYSPGAGSPPPELAGRDDVIEKVSIALQRIAKGRSGRSVILTGLRGTGKTVLLNHLRQQAESHHFVTVRLEATDLRSLPSVLAPALKAAILKLNRTKAAQAFVKKGLTALSRFVNAMRLRYQDIELGLEVDTEKKDEHSLNLDESLFQLFSEVGVAAKEKSKAVVLFIDELQMIEEEQLASLIMALHLSAQDQLPVVLVGAGLPQVSAKMGKAKTYAERLFEFIEIGQLDKEAAIKALTVPARRLRVHYSDDALKEILRQTQGYAYFLQEWGESVWECAAKSPITKKDAIVATNLALADLDASFFRVRFDQLTPLQKQYLRAMAELGSGSHGSGEIANVLNKPVTTLAPIRSQLITKGLVYSPLHGETAFTVPLFDEFMRRVMPLK